MRVAELLATFFSLIPKGESPESAYYTLSDGVLMYNGVRASCVASPVLKGANGVFTFRDLSAISILDSPRLHRDAEKVIFQDAKTTWTIAAREPSENVTPLTIPDEVKLETIPPFIRRARSLFTMKSGDTSVDAFTVGDQSFVAASSQRILLSVSSDQKFDGEFHISETGEVFDAIAKLDGKIGFDRNQIYVKATQTIGDTLLELKSSMKFSKPRTVVQAKEFTRRVHSGELEQGLIVTFEAPYDEIRELTGVIGKMESPTEMEVSVEDNAVRFHVSELYGRSLSRIIKANTTNKIRIRMDVINNRLLQFFTTATTTKTSELLLRFNIMPETRFLVIRPVVKTHLHTDVVATMRVRQCNAQ